MVRKPIIRKVDGLRGGKGSVEFYDIVTEEEFAGRAKMYSMIRILPSSSIGRHQHVGNTEPYYILSGHGIFEDNDGSRTEVGPGDVCLINFNESHSIENASDTENLDLMALIYNE